MCLNGYITDTKFTYILLETDDISDTYYDIC